MGFLAVDAVLIQFADGVARMIEAAGVAVILGGLAVALGRGALDASRGRSAVYAAVRGDIGRAILLGLELLVAADIIATVTAPQTPETVLQLAMIVLIRTFLSFSLETELEGRWPWRRAEASEGAAPAYQGLKKDATT